MYRFFPGIPPISIMIGVRRRKRTPIAFKLLVMICIKFLQDPGISCSVYSASFRSEESPKGSPFSRAFADLGAGRDPAVCHSEMSKHHLAKIFVEDFFCRILLSSTFRRKGPEVWKHNLLLPPGVPVMVTGKQSLYVPFQQQNDIHLSCGTCGRVRKKPSVATTTVSASKRYHPESNTPVTFHPVSKLPLPLYEDGSALRLFSVPAQAHG